MGVFKTEGGVFCQVGFTTGLILPYLERLFVGLLILLRVRINHYACGCIIARADDFLRVLPAVRSRSRSPQLPYTDMN